MALCVGTIPVLAVTLLPPPGWQPNPLPYSTITSGSSDDRNPEWSPDGRLITYVSHRGTVWALRVETPDGTSNRQLTSSGANASFPSWSPDSASIAFIDTLGSRADLKRAFVENSTISALTNGTLNVLPFQPGWSPDGKEILFFVDSNGYSLARLSLADGSVRVVARVQGLNVSAVWVSADEIIYSSLVGGKWQILSAGLGGGTIRTVLGGTANYLNPVMVPGTRELAYLSDEVPVTEYDRRYPCSYLPGDYNAWVIDLDSSAKVFQAGPVPIAHGVEETFEAPYIPGSMDPALKMTASSGGVVAYMAWNSGSGLSLYLWDTRRLWTTMSTVGPANANSTDPSWSPDRTSLAFSAVSEGHSRIYVLNSTGLILQMPPGEA